MSDKARELLSWYNGSAVSGRVQRFTHPRTTRRAELDAAAYLDWCADRGLDPKRLILARHEAIRWKARVTFPSMMRTTADFLAQFAEWGEGSTAADQLQERIAARIVGDNQRDTRPAPLAEAIRRANQVEPDVCMRHHAVPGFDPASRWCPSCPLRRQCYDLNWSRVAVH